MADKSGQGTGPTQSWSSVVSVNVSQRNKTNTREIRLEADEGVQCSLNNEEIERLLRRLRIGSDDFTSVVQACPERKTLCTLLLIVISTLISSQKIL